MSEPAGSWVPVPPGSGFGLDNLPYGIFSPPGRSPRAGVRIGEHVLDLSELAAAGLLPGIPGLDAALLSAPSLNGLLGLGCGAWRALRRRLTGLLSQGGEELRGAGNLVDRALVPVARARMELPVAVGDYVDFFSSLEHATNLGRILRPGQDPLLPNWRRLPVAYHGRSGSIVISGTPVRRPRGLVSGGAGVRLEPTAMLDFELELGFLTGAANELGDSIPAAAAREHIFGVVLVNDWSARDIQAFEYRPLGPFAAKSFATSISPWVVPLDALWPHRVAGPVQDPPPAPHLATGEPWGLDIELEVELRSAAMAQSGLPGDVVARTNARGLYWSAAQQLAHACANGARVRAGDLFATGTISGSERSARGSLIELAEAGARPLALSDGSMRTFLADGDTVTLRGWCPAAPGLGLGEVTGTVAPAGPAP